MRMKAREKYKKEHKIINNYRMLFLIKFLHLNLIKIKQWKSKLNKVNQIYKFKEMGKMYFNHQANCHIFKLNMKQILNLTLVIQQILNFFICFKINNNLEEI